MNVSVLMKTWVLMIDSNNSYVNNFEETSGFFNAGADLALEYIKYIENRPFSSIQ